jgi:hypothetical protein
MICCASAEVVERVITFTAYFWSEVRAGVALVCPYSLFSFIETARLGMDSPSITGMPWAPVPPTMATVFEGAISP